MAEKINDGGPAFAHFDQDAWANPKVRGGMSLRDYFAIHATHDDIQPFLYPDTSGRKLGAAAARYKFADSMLQAREIDHG